MKTTTIATFAAFSATALLPFAAFAQENTINLGIGARPPIASTTVHGNITASTTNDERGHGFDVNANIENKTDVKNRIAENRTDRNGKYIQTADGQIDHRIASLNTLSARIMNSKNLTAEQKANITANITATISGLTTLKAKIATDTGSTTLSDRASITKNFRVYELVGPQASIEAAADRELTLVGQMKTLGAKLQTRIAELKTKGVSTTAQDAAYVDFTAKVAAAEVSANAATAAVANLKADGGDKTIEASNKAALKVGRDSSKSAEASLRAARADVRAIMKNAHVKATVTASSTVNVH
jgi:hypothetical protein